MKDFHIIAANLNFVSDRLFYTNISQLSLVIFTHLLFDCIKLSLMHASQKFVIHNIPITNHIGLAV